MKKQENKTADSAREFIRVTVEPWHKNLLKAFTWPFELFDDIASSAVSMIAINFQLFRFSKKKRTLTEVPAKI